MVIWTVWLFLSIKCNPLCIFDFVKEGMSQSYKQTVAQEAFEVQEQYSCCFQKKKNLFQALVFEMCANVYTSSCYLGSLRPSCRNVYIYIHIYLPTWGEKSRTIRLGTHVPTLHFSCVCGGFSIVFCDGTKKKGSKRNRKYKKYALRSASKPKT